MMLIYRIKGFIRAAVRVRARTLVLIAAAAVAVSVSQPVFSQISTDPQDPFYTYAQGWYLKGYTSWLPQLRPYSLNAIKNILADVMNNAEGRDLELAQEFYDRITSDTFRIKLEGTYSKKYEKNRDTKDTSTTNQYAGGPFAVGDVQLRNWLSLGYSLGVYANNVEDSDVNPIWTNSAYDTVTDAVSVGPFDANINLNTNVAVTWDKLTIQGGVNRSGYGAFLGDDAALSDSSFHSPNFSVSYDGGKWSYSQIYAAVGASFNNGVKPRESDDGKGFSFHSIRFAATPKLNISFYESTVFKGTKLAYLMPAPFMAIQGIGDSNDNSQMGLLFEFHSNNGIEWATSLFADDIDLNKAFKLKFNTKNRVGIETGLIYSPLGNVVDMLTLNYTMVTPYTYAHWSYDDTNATFTDKSYNYLNYVNHGTNMGFSIPPNSDRIMFSAKFQPFKRLSLRVFTTFMRHGNAYESLTDDERRQIYYTNYLSATEKVFYVCTYDDGSNGKVKSLTEYNNWVKNDSPSETEKSRYTMVRTSGGNVYNTEGGYFAQQMFLGDDCHIDTAWDYLNFLSQSHVMSVYQIGVDMAFELPRFRLGTWTFKFGYTWEYIHNNGVQNAMLNYSSDYGTGIDSSDDTAWRNAYANWVSKLHDTINQYMYVGLKILY